MKVDKHIDNEPGDFIVADGHVVVRARPGEWNIHNIPQACHAILAHFQIPWTTFTFYRQFRRPDGKLITHRVCGSSDPDRQPDTKQDKKRLREEEKHTDCKCIMSEAEVLRRGMRITKKDGAGHIVGVEHPAPTIIDQLYLLKIIDDHQYFFATQYLTMRRMFLDPISFTGNRFYDAPESEPLSLNAIPIEMSDYLHICRAITNTRDQAILDAAITVHPDAVTLNHLLSMPERVQHAFSQLARLVATLWNEKKQCVSAKVELIQKGVRDVPPCCDGSCAIRCFGEKRACAKPFSMQD